MVIETNEPESELLAELARLVEEMADEDTTPRAVTTGMYQRYYGCSRTMAKTTLAELADAGFLRREMVRIYDGWGNIITVKGYVLPNGDG